MRVTPLLAYRQFCFLSYPARVQGWVPVSPQFSILSDVWEGERPWEIHRLNLEIGMLCDPMQTGEFLSVVFHRRGPILSRAGSAL